ncbi:hypothetical protein BC628DRAFT_502084 [Trametes gibbosa]|nr:hypothetical protein BC628DRAFT_502084 [Trametes gibbosa]
MVLQQPVLQVLWRVRTRSRCGGVSCPPLLSPIRAIVRDRGHCVSERKTIAVCGAGQTQSGWNVRQDKEMFYQGAPLCCEFRGPSWSTPSTRMMVRSISQIPARPARHRTIDLRSIDHRSRPSVPAHRISGGLRANDGMHDVHMGPVGASGVVAQGKFFRRQASPRLSCYKQGRSPDYV